jgi:hypothetical protein
MKARLGVVVAAAAVAAVLMTPAAASAKAPPGALDITEQVDCGAADCTVQVVGFNNVAGTLNAVLAVTNDATGETQRVSTPILVQQGGTCTIFELTIPPINIFVLGLTIQLDEVHLVITADRNSFLGALLCGLLGRGGPLAQNQLVAALNAALREGAVTVVPPG